MFTIDDIQYYLEQFALRYTDMDQFEASMAVEEFLNDQDELSDNQGNEDEE